LLPNSLQNRDLIWLVSFMDYDLGYVDLEEKTLQPLDRPFWAKSVTYLIGTIRNEAVKKL
jgi:hypothetical protein